MADENTPRQRIQHMTDDGNKSSFSAGLPTVSKMTDDVLDLEDNKKYTKNRSGWLPSFNFGKILQKISEDIPDDGSEEDVNYIGEDTDIKSNDFIDNNYNTNDSTSNFSEEEEDSIYALESFDTDLITACNIQTAMKTAVMIETKNLFNNYNFKQFICIPIMYHIYSNHYIEKQERITTIVHQYVPDHNDMDRFDWKIYAPVNYKPDSHMVDAQNDGKRERYRWQLFKIEEHYMFFISCISELLSFCTTLGTDLIAKYEYLISNLCKEFRIENFDSETTLKNYRTQRENLNAVLTQSNLDQIAEVLIFFNKYNDCGDEEGFKGLIHTYIPTSEVIQNFNWYIFCSRKYYEGDESTCTTEMKRFNLIKDKSVLLKATLIYIRNCYTLDEEKKSALGKTIKKICNQLNPG